jgi:drug/metabolite transporter superfamily protein YnfA
VRFLENKDILRLGVIFVVSMALSTVVTPYGLNGITIPFRFLSSDYSLYKKILYEWQPVWMNSSYGNISGFFIGVGLFALTGCFRLVIGFRNAHNKIGSRSTRLFFELFFSMATLITIAMAASSRRFITYAVIFSAISCAIYLKQIFLSIKFSRIALVVLNIILIAVASRLLWVNIEQYPAINSAENDGTFYERMFFVNPDYPVKLAKFISANGISGNVFCYWTWEGYLRYHCPKIKVFAGGRAHQIYDNSIFSLYLRMLDKNPPISSLGKLNTSFIAMPSRYKFSNLIKALFADPNWEVLYADNRDILFAFKKLVPDTSWKSHLRYPDNESMELSSCAAILNKCSDVTSGICFEADSIVKNNYICPWYYFLKTKRFADAGGNKGNLESNLLTDLNRFIYIASGNRKGLSILESTDDILQALIDYYHQTGTSEKVNGLIPYLEIQKRIPIKR